VAKVLVQVAALARPWINTHKGEDALLEEAAPLAAAHRFDSAVRTQKPDFNRIVRRLGQDRLHLNLPVRQFTPQSYNQLALRITHRIPAIENVKRG
jgi:hypothetical protein